MKFKQEKPEFQPITIIIETKEEAQQLLRMVDDSSHHYITARKIANRISDAFTNMEIVI